MPGQRQVLAGFQSTPPSEERSDDTSQRRYGSQRDVSIHAPLRREERLAWALTSVATRGFNPRPPPKRGATSLAMCYFHRSRFQSTPPSEERSDTSLSAESRANAADVSIHAPLRREERRCVPVRKHRLRPVSIHAPLRREERRLWVNVIFDELKFQSTPPSEERSDQENAINCY